ncbi:glucose 1-dehydrogenase [Striga asiatica]|uniref:Glucose 1-dehydrogenase n=1 Tax=Striga asiatica TaxID=4170 RepID=A0A5A7P7X2_STRAF|nr:glucose 1-dehydrogenase [Striga asiatica]
MSFSPLGFLSPPPLAAQALSGGSKCRLATSGGGPSSPFKATSPFSRRGQGPSLQMLQRESTSCPSSRFATGRFWASSSRPFSAASRTSASSLDERCMKIRSGITIGQAECDNSRLSDLHEIAPSALVRTVTSGSEVVKERNQATNRVKILR